MLTTKRAFILYFMILSERGHHVHQTNYRFVYVGLNADCSYKYGATCKFYFINQDTIIIFFSRNKVEIVIRFKIPFQMNRPWARSASTNFDNKNKLE